MFTIFNSNNKNLWEFKHNPTVGFLVNNGIIKILKILSLWKQKSAKNPFYFCFFVNA